MDENKSFFKKDQKKVHNNTKNQKKEDKFKTVIFLSLILLIFFELFIIIIQNTLIKNKPQEEKEDKYRKVIKDIKNENYSDSFVFKSYAQYLEDIILFLFLHDVKNGFYIDVGANDPIIDSVTNFFYLRDWNGINIEPLDDKYALLKNQRPRDINLNIVAGKEKGSTTLYIFKGLTTTMKNYSLPGMAQKLIKVETMADICKKYVPQGTVIDFCKIDVEGAERNVLLGYDFINYRPKIFCIEATLPLTMKPSYQLFEDILIKNNYSFVYQYNVNRFYVDNKSNFVNNLRQRVILIDLFMEKYNETNILKNNFYK